MAQETRINGEIPIFGDDALPTEIKKFGTIDDSTDINDLLSTTEAKRGWFYLGTDGFPKKEHFNALTFAMTKFIKYLYQWGIPEWNINQKYFTSGKSVASDGFTYTSKTDNNIGNTPVGDSINWRLAFLDSANTVPYTPTEDYHPATKKYVLDNTLGIASTSEAQDGTNDTKAITPLKLHEAMLGGVEQSWQDVLSSRAVSTVYTNITGRPILVSVTVDYAGSGKTGLLIRVDGLTIGRSAFEGSTTEMYANVCVIVPNGSTYEILKDISQLSYWTELR